MAEGTEGGLGMQFDLQPRRHQLERPPDLVTAVAGVSYLAFEGILCGCEVGLRPDSQGEIDGQFNVPPERMRA